MVSRGIFLTFGQYDMVAFSAIPDAEATAKLQLTAALEGDIETSTLRSQSAGPSESEYVYRSRRTSIISG